MTIWKLAAVLVGFGAAGTGAVLFAGFGAFLPWRENAEVARLTTLAGVREGQTIGEIGAGGGRFSLALAQAVGARGRVYARRCVGAETGPRRLSGGGRYRVPGGRVPHRDGAAALELADVAEHIW